jgi:hypothetical protein
MVLLLACAALLFAQWHCPEGGCALSTASRALIRLKNREALPQAADFDERVTLAALVQTGDDDARWSSTRAAALEGYVVGVEDGAIESANCFSLNRRDTHIAIALNLNAPASERVILEVSPRMRDWASHNQGRDWSTNALRRELLGRRCRFEGWLLFDTEHADQSRNTAPAATGNWRATAWELHPITAIKVLN